MRKKNDSLLSKLKEENQANSITSNILSDIENLIPKLKAGTVLTKKISEIRILQQKNELVSSNIILDIINDTFEYKYPSYISIYGKNNNYNFVKQDLIKTDHLKNHIYREAELNSVSNNLNLAIKYSNKKKGLLIQKNKKANNSEGLWQGCGAYIGIVIGGGLILFIFLSFFVSYGAAGTLIYVIGVLTLLAIIYAFYHSLKSKELDKEIIEINKLINKQVYEIKTKANNVYN